jgi:carbon-monoxide dehydrogenase medium subunit
MKPVAFDYHRARGVADVLSSLTGESRALAGGCSLGPMLNLRLARPSALVDIRSIGEMRQLTQTAEGLIIGACWTHSEIEDAIVPDVTRGFMRRVAHGIAYRPVRNRGTLGGSLAHADPAADWLTACVALNAIVHIGSAAGPRAERVASFVTAPYSTRLSDGELIVGIAVPALSERASWAYYKICRKTGEFALAIGAAISDPERGYARVVCGAVESAPIILTKASDALNGGDILGAQTAAAEEIAARLSAHEAAFVQMHQVAVERALAELTQ